MFYLRLRTIISDLNNYLDVGAEGLGPPRLNPILNGPLSNAERPTVVYFASSLVCSGDGCCP